LAGISFVLVDVSADRIMISKGETVTLKKKNNVYAELAAIVMALEECEVLLNNDTVFRICSDCEPALEIAAGNRLVRTPKMKSMVTKLEDLLEKYPCDIHFQWVRSHSNHPINDFADLIAYHHARG